MRVCVYGLWHLGSVTAACLASRGIKTIGLTEDAQAASKLSAARAPLFEPSLDAMLAQGLQDGHLSFTSDVAAALAATDLLWVTFDTPVDDADIADVHYVLDRIRRTFPHLRDGAVVLISSQVPVGSTALLERDFARVADGRKVSFAYSPENLRLGDAIRVFTQSERIVIGIRERGARRVIEPILRPFCDTLLWLRVESAEMVKHALNAYLATCVTFTNEVASLCEGVGADMSEVEGALRLDPRIGEKAYVRAGAAFGGGTLARDVQFLKVIAKDIGAQVPVLAAVLESNDYHKGWVVRHLRDRLGTLKSKKIGVLGLAYKAGTDTVRRSVAIEVIRELIEEGADITVYDPKVISLPDSLHSLVNIAPSVDAVFVGSEAVVLATAWPEFRELDFGKLMQTMKRALLVDQNAFLSNQVSDIAGINYIIAGKAR